MRAGGGTFTSTGSDCNTACKYLEAAPTDQSAGIVWATGVNVCYAEGSDVAVSSCASLAGSRSIYPHPDQAASRTAALEIGMGMSNTNQIYARITTAGRSPANEYAAGVAWAYTNNGKTDWHLPSRDELNQMCKWQRGVAWTSDATVCTLGTLNSGPGASGFSDVGGYWSSSEGEAENAWGQSFGHGGQGNYGKLNNDVFLRPVRAFG